MAQDQKHVVILYRHSNRYCCEDHYLEFDKKKDTTKKRIFILSKPDNRYICFKCQEFKSIIHPTTEFIKLFGDIDFNGRIQLVSSPKKRKIIKTTPRKKLQTLKPKQTQEQPEPLWTLEDIEEIETILGW